MLDSQDIARDATVAVVGAGGFLGRRLMTALSKEGIGAIARGRNDAIVDVNGRLVPPLGRARVVCYLASTINPKIAEDHPDRAEADRASFMAFLGAVARAQDPPRVIFPSSGGTVYDVSTSPPYDETSPVRASSVYGRTKLAMETALLEHLQDRGCILRISNAYGPGQLVGTGQGVIAHWLHSALEGSDLRVFGEDGISRDYVFVDDVARAFIRAGTQERVPNIVNIGSGITTSLGELLEIVLDVVGRAASRVVRLPGRGFDLARNSLDIAKARVELGWKPEVGLREGIEITWRLMLDRAH